jgi:hypothetical protein
MLNLLKINLDLALYTAKINKGVLKSRRDNFAGKFHNQNSDLIIYNTD